MFATLNFDEWATQLHHVKTRFVPDRIRETSFEDRERMIRPLLAFERLITSQGYIAGMARRMCENTFPVETACILRELNDGIHTSNEEYVRLLQTHNRRTARQRRLTALRDAQQARRTRQQAFEFWESMRKSEL
ncbi:MAG: hypothetical protein ACYCS1_01990 [Gammaproteobacteria bacterium]